MKQLRTASCELRTANCEPDCERGNQLAARSSQFAVRSRHLEGDRIFVQITMLPHTSPVTLPAIPVLNCGGTTGPT